jgi:hypothetical protein
MTVKKNRTSKVGLGMGIVAAATLATAAGYYLYGKNGDKNRKKVSLLARKAYAEVVRRTKKLKWVSKADYHKIVRAVEYEYRALKSIDKKDLKSVAADLKKRWQIIEREARSKENMLAASAKKAGKAMKKKLKR